MLRRVSVMYNVHMEVSLIIIQFYTKNAHLVANLNVYYYRNSYIYLRKFGDKNKHSLKPMT